MHERKLTQPVVITGKTHWGDIASLVISPIDRPGWWWKRPDGKIVAITFAILRYDDRRLILKSDGYRFEVIEHIVALAFKGLVNGVLLECINQTHHAVGSIKNGCWPPADGTAAYYWQGIESTTVILVKQVPWHPIEQMGRWQDHDRVVVIEPKGTMGTRLSIHIDYPDVGSGDAMFHLSGNCGDMTDIFFKYPSPGMLLLDMSWEESYRAITSSADLPSAETMFWPHQHDQLLTKMAFVAHRATDMLAALFFLAPPGYLPACSMMSFCGGHKGDYVAVENVLEER